MLRKEIYIGNSYRVRDYGEMLSDPKLKHDADGRIWYPRSRHAFTPDMKHLCGQSFMCGGIVDGEGSIAIWNRKFRSGPDNSGPYYAIAPWMVESTSRPYTGKTYLYEEEPEPEIDREQIGLLFADLFGNT